MPEVVSQGDMPPREYQKHTLGHAANMVRTYGAPIQISPPQALLQEVHRTAGHVQWLHEVIADMAPDELIAGTKKTVEIEKSGGSGDKDGFVYTEDRIEVTAGAHIWVKLYQQEREMLRRVCYAAIQANIEERYVQLEEQRATELAKAITNMVRELGHSMQDESVRNIVRTNLQALNASV